MQKATKMLRLGWKTPFSMHACLFSKKGYNAQRLALWQFAYLC